MLETCMRFVDAGSTNDYLLCLFWYFVGCLYVAQLSNVRCLEDGGGLLGIVCGFNL